ncbi:MAG: glycoside hydrolase family 48 protein, partial [Thermodesulfobacteriota bacterium]|nr:glycoside hydrolase family 48 protein [Thermodesulfobacteriota bacterium]
NNQGNPPNATHRTEIGGLAARAAYHVFEDNATHLCNGGATTSETQALFFNFMTLYAALTGNRDGAREAYAYLRYFMMPHDGAESPQLPDSQLGIGGNHPVLIHWLIDISGQAQGRACPDGRPGSGVFGENTPYNMYDPTHGAAPFAILGRNNSGQVDLTQRQTGGGRHAASFANAMDADQWLVNGAFWAARYGLGNPGDLLRNLRKGLSEGLTPSDAQFHPNVSRFAIYWGEDQVPDIAYRGSLNQLYSGYQDPAAWEIMGRHGWAQNVVKFLADAQKEFKRKHRQEGPFMPVFKDGTWGWQGDDPNTHWMGFQYRTFAHLAHYYHLTGDQEAKKVLDKFISWYKRNRRISNDQISIPMELENGRRNTGSIRRRGYGPHEFALMAQGLIFIAAKDDNSQLRQEAEKILDFMLTQRAANGSFHYTDPDPENNGTYGFHNAEAGIAYGLYTLLLEQGSPPRPRIGA